MRMITALIEGTGDSHCVGGKERLQAKERKNRKKGKRGVPRVRLSLTKGGMSI